ncbi:MAG: rane-bound dehydrogenase domain protein, partial [Verrucomicrobiales bacterium]|nr:rane-bound dehydrogenase domain protein [Verrucomicrobiales bacterium]
MILSRPPLLLQALALSLLPASLLPAEDLPLITIRTPAAQMKYDKSVITATPGSQVRLIFENLDEMPHNFVLCQPLPDKNDKGMEVAVLAWQMGAQGMHKGWIPDSPRILAHTGLVPAHGKEELVLKIPDQPGTYPYVCTFPGHAMAMNGELRVLQDGPKFSNLDYKLYLGEFKTLPDFSTLTPHRT